MNRKRQTYERVHDRHGFGRDTSVRVHLLQHLVDVDGKRFLPPLLLLFLVGGTDSLLGLACLLDGLAGRLGGHVDDEKWWEVLEWNLNCSENVGEVIGSRPKHKMIPTNCGGVAFIWQTRTQEDSQWTARRTFTMQAFAQCTMKPANAQSHCLDTPSSLFNSTDCALQTEFWSVLFTAQSRRAIFLSFLVGFFVLCLWFGRCPHSFSASFLAANRFVSTVDDERPPDCFFS